MSAPASTDERDRPEIHAAINERFGANTRLAAAYAQLLGTAGIERGMIGPREAERVWERHLINSAALAPLVPAEARVVDLGSGAGLPGIPLAIARPDLRVMLLEPMQRRVNFLELCLAELDLPRVTIQRGRAEAGIEERADVVVVRAVAALDAIVGLSARLLRPGGTVLALKGDGAAAEVEQMAGSEAIQAELLTVPAPGRDATIVRLSGDIAALTPAPVGRSTKRASRGRR